MKYKWGKPKIKYIRDGIRLDDWLDALEEAYKKDGIEIAYITHLIYFN